eukprot:CAMPEP_0201479838 /NCGR_PEP_ID=MMETSP0151_2-20130828/4479_1 /ASSEMBLY_ACC=CAM_ASM_000257 /TAXON_ID=200890 /ORGANISM="Paramoeba atlantica, Strain 621/1 / CCAP 1560/9" /LENGTH=179 /DNA_ID=CAMNT_0047861519 /DNA_START=42 /DNA_END=581 /DNA_ORIENTATION=-
MFSRVLPSLAENIVKLRRRVTKKPWAGNSAPTCALRVFISKIFKGGTRGPKNITGAHDAFKALPPAQVESLSKIAAENMKQKKALVSQVKSARFSPYTLFVQRTIPAILEAEKENHKDRMACFRAAVKQVSFEYQKLSAAQRNALSNEAAQMRKKGKALIQRLVEKKKLALYIRRRNSF